MIEQQRLMLVCGDHVWTRHHTWSSLSNVMSPELWERTKSGCSQAESMATVEPGVPNSGVAVRRLPKHLDKKGAVIRIVTVTLTIDSAKAVKRIPITKGPRE